MTGSDAKNDTLQGRVVTLSATTGDSLGAYEFDNYHQVNVLAAYDGTQAIAIPAAADLPGKLLGVKKTGSAGAVTLTPASGTIADGATYAGQTAEGDYALFLASGTDWKLLFRGTVGADIARSELEQEDLAVFNVKLRDLQVTGTGALLGASAGTPSGAFGITAGTHATASPTIVSEAASGNTKTNKARFQFVLPENYVAGETITLRVAAVEAVGAATVSTTIDAVVVATDGDGTVGSDICATAAQDVTATLGNKSFTITPTGLEPGDELDIELTGVVNDTGGTVGTVLTIPRIDILLDIKG